MAAKSAYLKSKLLRHALGIEAFVMPATAYFALYSTNPTEDDTGTEISGGVPAYARQPLAMTEADGLAETSAVVSFNPPTTTVYYWGIRDALTGGNLLYFGAFDIEIPTVSGTPLTFSAGNIRIGEE